MDCRLAPSALALLCACAPPALEDTGDANRPADGAIEILFPKTSLEVRYCPQFTMVVQVDDFELDPEAIGADPVEGVGHWQLWTGSDCELELIGQSGEPFFELQEPLPAGTNVLYAELVTNDSQPLDPPVRYRTAIVVSEDEELCISDPGGEQ